MSVAIAQVAPCAEASIPKPSLPGCQPFCSKETEHDHDGVFPLWNHIRRVGTIPVQANDVAHGRGDVPNPGLDVEVSINDQDDEPAVVLSIEGEGEAIVLTAEQAAVARDLLAEAVRLLNGGA